MTSEWLLQNKHGLTCRIIHGNSEKVLKRFKHALAPPSFAANAFETQESSYLRQIFNQLDALQPLILSAAKVQPRQARIQFHYTRYKDTTGKTHNGLLEDVQQIKAGIAAKLDRPAIEPRIVLPLQGDYLASNKG